MATIEEVFWAKVDRSLGDLWCWRWLGSHRKNGYPLQASYGAHRLSYELNIGDIPNGLVIDHLCRHPWCVNPHHLEAVTVAENTRRGESPAIRRSRENRCAKGHELTPENTIVYQRGRRCKTCRREYERERRREKVRASGREPRIYKTGFCGKGHPLSGDNLGSDGRTCRECHRERARQRRERQRQRSA